MYRIPRVDNDDHLTGTGNIFAIDPSIVFIDAHTRIENTSTASLLDGRNANDDARVRRRQTVFIEPQDGIHSESKGYRRGPRLPRRGLDIRHPAQPAAAPRPAGQAAAAHLLPAGVPRAARRDCAPGFHAAGLLPPLLQRAGSCGATALELAAPSPAQGAGLYVPARQLHQVGFSREQGRMVD
jgi:hypothetical protein